MILDTYPLFKRSWKRIRVKNLNALLDLWKDEYMSEYPMLFELQVKNYEDLGVNWGE